MLLKQSKLVFVSLLIFQVFLGLGNWNEAEKKKEHD
jgi:hypothetical protein